MLRVMCSVSEDTMSRRAPNRTDRATRLAGYIESCKLGA